MTSARRPLTLAVAGLLAAGLGLAPAAPALAVDAPPRVTSLSLSATRVNVTSTKATVTLTARVTDDRGVREAVAVVAPEGGGAVGQPVAMTRVGGTATDGTWRGTVAIPAHGDTGPWNVVAVARDTSGQRTDDAGRWVAVYDDAVGGTLPRFAGTSRYGTAAELALHSYGEAETVYVASGEGFADALAAGPAAQDVDAPLLLVRQGSVPTATLTALRTLNPRRIVVAGQGDVVSEAVLDELARTTRGGTRASVVRAAGADRYATAAALSRPVLAKGPTSVVLASGETFPDALSAAPLASQLGTGLLLTKSARVPAATMAALRAVPGARVLVVGGPDVVSPAVVAQLQAAGHPVTRLAGSDRYGTAAAVAKRFPVGSTAWVATGVDYPDALVASTAPDGIVGPIALVRPTGVPTATASALTANRTTWLIIMGGLDVVPAPLEWQLSPWFELN